MSEQGIEERVKRAEPHVRTVFTIIGAIVLGFVTIAVKDMPAAMARMEVQMETQAAQIFDLRQQVKEGSDNRYRVQDAQKDFGRVYEQLAELKARVSVLERSQRGEGR